MTLRFAIGVTTPNPDDVRTSPSLPTVHHAPELVIAGILTVIGVLSLVKWARTEFEAESSGERLLYTLHITSRVGMWFALAGFFVGYAIVDEPQSLGWYVFVVIGLAGVRLLTGFYLWRSSSRSEGKGQGMIAGHQDPEDIDKRGGSAIPGAPQPEAAEVESARLLANDARGALREDGLTDEEIEMLADEFIAEHVGEDVSEFIEWARNRSGGPSPSQR
jgi:hypothetical protein